MENKEIVLSVKDLKVNFSTDHGYELLLVLMKMKTSLLHLQHTLQVTENSQLNLQ